MTNFQRIGSSSNVVAGRNFENASKIYVEKQLGRTLTFGKKIEIGISDIKKSHKFDIGDDETIIECKTHKWTTGDHVPSAKLTVWNEAMYYFSLVSNSFTKIFIIEKHLSEKRNNTLGLYYIKTYGHLIPEDVEIWEFDETNNSHDIINSKRQSAL
ncbi:hypothetical protein [Flavobacterium sp.]|uniref:hypothetical protein n=1 Tax=Flavobacterium sp. TaxID=239 RepID=UPI0024883A7C|nr:hypothetical protein [Flavobacterium sp.]MDI1318090.1 hypothetical protein [Flavobacterium sp.]